MSVICEDAMSVFMMNISRLVSCFRTSFVFNEARHHEKLTFNMMWKVSRVSTMSLSRSNRPRRV